MGILNPARSWLTVNRPATLEALVGPRAIPTETENSTAEKAQDVLSEKENQTQLQTLNQSHNQGDLVLSDIDRIYETSSTTPLEAHKPFDFGECGISGSPQSFGEQDQSQTQTGMNSMFDLTLDLANLPLGNMVFYGCTNTNAGQSLGQRLSFVSADLMLSDFAVAEL